MRLGVPCRVLTCAHLQCFDAVFFLQMNEKKPTWTCPVCDKPAPFELLTIDGYVVRNRFSHAVSPSQYQLYNSLIDLENVHFELKHLFFCNSVFFLFLWGNPNQKYVFQAAVWNSERDKWGHWRDRILNWRFLATHQRWEGKGQGQRKRTQQHPRVPRCWYM